MRHGKFALIVLFLVVTAGVFYLLTQQIPPEQTMLPTELPTSQPSATYFDDSDPTVLRLGNAAAELTFDKENGAILALVDRSNGETLVRSVEGANLWSASFLYSYQSADSGDFSPGSAQKFSYEWDVSAQTLRMIYSPDPAETKNVSVTVEVAADEANAFQLQMTMDNHWGYEASEIRFPQGLRFERDAVQAALLPIMPGIELNKGFFERGANYEVIYPGWPGVFADFMAVSLAQGNVALYATSETEPFVPVFYGLNFTHCPGEAWVCYTHNIRPRAKSGTQWQSPVFHLRVGEDWRASIDAYRVDSGIAQSPSLEEKLGPLFETVTASPLYKADADQLSIPFERYAALLRRIPEPGILHLMAYGPGGFDRNYPDFLPPDERFGTTDDLSDMAVQAREMGFLVMPYINPTWWDRKSPTLSNLPQGTRLQDVTAMNDQGLQFEECYGCPANPRYGYVVSPQSPFVQERLARLIGDIDAADIADLLFEDQIGARAAIYDYGPAAPSGDSYLQGWLEHTRQYADNRLATEGGFDELVPTQVGMHMSVLLPDRRGETNAWWGEGNWKYYPFVVQAAGDKVLFYQHNLAPESFTHGKATLLWNMAMGYQLSHDLVKSTFGGGVAGEMLPVVGAFQRYVMAEYAGRQATGFTRINESITQTSYDDLDVYANWDARKTFRLGDHSVPGYGFLVLKKDGSLTAGLFNNYNGLELSAGEHYLIEQRKPGEVIVRQPKGDDTALRIQADAGWDASTALVSQAYGRDGKLLQETPVNVEDGHVMFEYARVVDGQSVAYYRIGSR